MKLFLISTLLFLLLSFSTYGIEPKFIFELGSSLDSLQKDPRFKGCLFVDNKLARFFEGNGNKNTERYICKDVEKTKEISLGFYKKKLILIAVDFKEFDDRLNMLSLLTIDNPSNNKMYRENILGLLEAADSSCRKAGPPQGEKTDEPKKSTSGIIAQNATITYTDNKKYKCIIFYQKLTYEQYLKIGKWWQFPESVTLQNVPETILAISEEKSSEKVEIDKGKKKFNF